VSGRVFGCLRPLVLGAVDLGRMSSLARRSSTGGLDFWPAYLSGGSRYLMCPPSLMLVKGHSPYVPSLLSICRALNPEARIQGYCEERGVESRGCGPRGLACSDGAPAGLSKTKLGEARGDGR